MSSEYASRTANKGSDTTPQVNMGNRNVSIVRPLNPKKDIDEIPQNALPFTIYQRSLTIGLTA